MSANPEDSIDLDALGEDGLEGFPDLEAGGTSAGGLLSTVWYYHPVIFLSVSLLLAGMAVYMWPERMKIEKPSLNELYESGLESYRKVTDLDHPLSVDARDNEIMGALADFEMIFKHYYRDLYSRPDLINPYMLLADCSRLYAENIPRLRKRRIDDAVKAYEGALFWEERRTRDAESEQVYAKQYPLTYTSGGKMMDELEVRKKRRSQYLRYHKAVMEIELERFISAKATLEELVHEFRREELERNRGGSSDSSKVSRLAGAMEYLPGDFELVTEDRIRLHYLLGMIYEKRGELDAAEREYRVFLLNSPRSNERFLALMRLGGMYTVRGKRSVSASMTKGVGGGEGALVVARRYFNAAADMYAQVVEASAPENILREAYFRGGMAQLLIAENLAVGRETWWDVLANRKTYVRGVLEDFAGRQLPDRFDSIPAAFGRILLEEGTGFPEAVAGAFRGAAGAAISFASRPRKTQRSVRDELLKKARVYFEGAQGGTSPNFDAEARVMIARTLLAEGKREQSRQLFRHTMATHPGEEVRIACIHGVAESFRQEGELDRARVRLLGGLEYMDPSLLAENEITDWRALARELYPRDKDNPDTPARRIWTFLPPDARAAVREAFEARYIKNEMRSMILKALNTVMRQRDFYWEKNFRNVALGGETRDLLARDRIMLNDLEIQRLNRTLFEVAFPQEIMRSHPPQSMPALPAADELPVGLLVSEDDIMTSLQRLAEAYVIGAQLATEDARQADARAEVGREDSSHWNRLKRRAMIDKRKNLMAALDVNEFLLRNYNPDRPETLMQTAELYQDHAKVLLGPPFFMKDRAREFTSRSARTYLRVAEEAPGSQREEEALWMAGHNFYSAGQFERAVEAFTYFTERHEASDRASAAMNMLGRSYRNLGLMKEAVTVFKRNLLRKTPDGRKALYYLGSVYMAAENIDGVDCIGDPQKPYPEMDDDGTPRIKSALQVFNTVRRLRGISWESRPWRWATFDLGLVWFRIGERERALKPDIPSAWVEPYRKAEAVLQESLDRYVLKRTKDDHIGLDRHTEPEDYREVMRARLVSEYYLAKSQLVLDNPQSARRHLAAILDPAIYPDWTFGEGAQAQEATEEETLGRIEGPEYPVDRLVHLRRNSFFLLGKSLFDKGDRLLEQNADEEEWRPVFREAYNVFQAAHDRLPPRDAPAVIYQMAECLRKLGLREEAVGKYALARNAARQLKGAGAEPLTFIGPDFWESMADSRFRDQQEKLQQ